MRVVLAILLLQSVAGAQEGYLGSRSCGACHAAKLAAQNASEHAHALARPADHALAASFAPDRTFLRAGRYSFRFFYNDAKQLQVRAFDDTRQIDIPLEWAFGAGSQAVTFASRVNGEWYLEHALSYFSAAKSYSTTPGQPAPAEDTLPAALGRLYRTTDPDTGILQCFECHSTGPVNVASPGTLQPSEPGVHCEACHGPGRDHAAAAQAGKAAQARTLIQNPGRMSPGELNTFCGKCHRPPAAAGVEIDWNVSWNVRHQPVYLSQAACFRKSSGTLSCLTCHDPHTALHQDDRFYNAKCAACHNATSHPPAAACTAATPAGCVNCHMPRVSPQSWLRFTNHWIGVYGEGSRLKPRQ